MKVSPTKKENSKASLINLKTVDIVIQIGRMRIISNLVRTRMVNKVKPRNKSPMTSICHFKLTEGELEVWLSLLQT